MSTARWETAPSRFILGMRVDGTSYERASQEVVLRASEAGGGYVCVANVHMAMEAHDDASYREVVNRADLVTPDGVPLVWALRHMGIPDSTRVYGPNLMLAVVDLAARRGVPIGLYGSTAGVLKELRRSLLERCPQLRIEYSFSPPFRPLDRAEDDALVEEINASGARILFVGLGCPRQERWMAEHSDRIHAVMLGVGAAFDFLAGCKPQAPRWMQNAGLEWVFRLATEPRRLWKRYAKHNPRFVALVARQLLFGSRGRE